MLTELIARYRAEAISFDEFVSLAAGHFVPTPTPSWPSFDLDVGVAFGVSNATIANAVFEGLLDADEAAAIFAALPVPA